MASTTKLSLYDEWLIAECRYIDRVAKDDDGLRLFAHHRLLHTVLSIANDYAPDMVGFKDDERFSLAYPYYFDYLESHNNDLNRIFATPTSDNFPGSVNPTPEYPSYPYQRVARADVYLVPQGNRKKDAGQFDQVVFQCEVIDRAGEYRIEYWILGVGSYVDDGRTRLIPATLKLVGLPKGSVALQERPAEMVTYEFTKLVPKNDIKALNIGTYHFRDEANRLYDSVMALRNSKVGPFSPADSIFAGDSPIISASAAERISGVTNYATNLSGAVYSMHVAKEFTIGQMLDDARLANIGGDIANPVTGTLMDIVEIGDDDQMINSPSRTATTAINTPAPRSTRRRTLTKTEKMSQLKQNFSTAKTMVIEQSQQLSRMTGRQVDIKQDDIVRESLQELQDQEVIDQVVDQMMEGIDASQALQYAIVKEEGDLEQYRQKLDQMTGLLNRSLAMQRQMKLRFNETLDTLQESKSRTKVLYGEKQLLQNDLAETSQEVSRLRAIEQDYLRVVSQLEVETRRASDANQVVVPEMTRQLQQYAQELKNVSNERVELQRRVDILEQQVLENNGTIESLEDMSLGLEDLAKEKKSKIDELEAQLQQMAKNVADWKQYAETQEATITRLELDLKARDAQVSQLQSELSRLQIQVETKAASFASENKILQAERATLQADAIARAQEIGEQRARIAILNTENAQLQLQYQSAITESNNLTNKYNELYKNYQTLEMRVRDYDALNSKIASMPQGGNQQNVVLQQQLATVTRQYEALQSEYGKTRAANESIYADAVQQLKQSSQSVQNIKSEQMKLAERLEQEQQKIKIKENTEKALRSEMERLKVDLDKAKTDLALSVQRASQATESGSRATSSGVQAAQTALEQQVLQLQRERDTLVQQLATAGDSRAQLESSLVRTQQALVAKSSALADVLQLQIIYNTSDFLMMQRFRTRSARANASVSLLRGYRWLTPELLRKEGMSEVFATFLLEAVQ